MAATISVPALRISSRAGRYATIGLQFGIATLVAYAAVYQLFLLSAVILLVADYGGLVWRRERTTQVWLARLTPLIVGLSVIAVIGLSIRGVSQIILMLLYGAWRTWRVVRPAAMPEAFWELLAMQALVFQAVFMAADRWYEVMSRPLVMMLLWVATYTLAYQALTARGERAAGALAAAWALVVTEAAWVFLTWLVSYVAPGHFLVVPQAALVLTALAYCFGSIYVSQRTGSLNRARFTEYLLIGLILIWIVIAGTQWRGTL